MSYAINKAKARTITRKPSLTDQSQARDTDINIIVGRYLKTGTAPGAGQQPIYGDYSNLPTDLRGFLETSRTLHAHRHKLPEPLKNMTVEEILALTRDELTNILTPPATTPATPPGETK